MLVVTAFCTVLILWKGVVLLRSAVYVTRISASRKGGPIRGSGKPARPARLGMPCVSLGVIAAKLDDCPARQDATRGRQTLADASLPSTGEHQVGVS
jgi:hypothetical protein